MIAPASSLSPPKRRSEAPKQVSPDKASPQLEKRLKQYKEDLSASRIEGGVPTPEAGGDPTALRRQSTVTSKKSLENLVK